jgi:OmpA-OmpF porin, OOP family
MRQQVGLALGAFAFVCASDAAAQQTFRWQDTAMPRGLYLGLQGGASFLEDNDFRGGGTDSKAKYDPGPAGMVTLGYGFDFGLRLELEGGYRRNGVDRIGGTSGNGRLEVGSAMLNAIYDVPLPTFGIPVLPHIGAGVGWNHVWNRSRPHNGLSVRGQDDLFAWQAIAGVDYVITPNLVAGLDYKYMRGNNASFDIVETGATSKAGDQVSHSVLVGLRYYFGAPARPAPRAEPAAAPALVPPPTPPAPPAALPRAEPRSYTVFFDFDRADLDASAVPIVDQAAANARTGRATRIELNAHADRSGSDRYNQRLSERRAETVRQELVRRGVPASDIAVVAQGERQPAVPTADGVREPRNRRVEIVLQTPGA